MTAPRPRRAARPAAPALPVLPALLLALAAPHRDAHCQAPAPTASRPAAAAVDSGGFVFRLGRDTVGFERFVRAGDRIEGWHLWRSPRAAMTHYVLTTDASGRPAELSAERRPAADTDIGATAPGGGRLVVMFGGDSAVTRVEQGDTTHLVSVPIASGAPVAAMLPMTFALYEQLVRQALATGEDSVVVATLYAGQAQVHPTTVRRHGRDSVLIDFFGAPFRARIDGAQRLLGVDGRGTTMALEVRRVPSLDFGELRHAVAQREQRGSPMGQLSPRDTARATIAGATLLVDYGRPAKRGRAIFGALVPYGKVWRTGANAATHFRTNRELAFGNTVIPEGTYTLWTIPAEDGATLVINRRTGQWGTDYDASQDVLRVPMTVERARSPVERFTIAIEPAGTRGGVLVISWDDRVWRAPFVVRN